VRRAGLSSEIGIIRLVFPLDEAAALSLSQNETIFPMSAPNLPALRCRQVARIAKLRGPE
jgi:hypothetical protein